MLLTLEFNCIFGFHTIFSDCHDDWGLYDVDHEQGTAEYFVGKYALRAIHEYQHQLFKDIDFVELDKLINEDRLIGDHPLNRDHHFHTYGKIGVMFTDNRGAQAMHKVPGDKKDRKSVV